MSRRNVEVRIEELVLRGFPPGEKHRIRDAVERELSRLFVERGVPSSMADGGEISVSDAGTLRTDQGAGEIGARVAEAVYTTIAGSSKRGGI